MSPRRDVSSVAMVPMCTGCPAKLFPLGYLLFCRLLLMQIAKVGTFLKNSGNLLRDGHSHLEIAEIIDVKVGKHHLEIDILPITH